MPIAHVALRASVFSYSEGVCTAVWPSERFLNKALAGSSTEYQLTGHHPLEDTKPCRVEESSARSQAERVVLAGLAAMSALMRPHVLTRCHTRARHMAGHGQSERIQILRVESSSPRLEIESRALVGGISISSVTLRVEITQMLPAFVPGIAFFMWIVPGIGRGMSAFILRRRFWKHSGPLLTHMCVFSAHTSPECVCAPPSHRRHFYEHTYTLAGREARWYHGDPALLR